MPGGVGAFVAEGEVVFVGAAVIAITFQNHSGFIELLEDVFEDFSVGVEKVGGVGAEIAFVEFEVDVLEFGNFVCEAGIGPGGVVGFDAEVEAESQQRDEDRVLDAENAPGLAQGFRGPYIAGYTGGVTEEFVAGFAVVCGSLVTSSRYSAADPASLVSPS